MDKKVRLEKGGWLTKEYLSDLMKQLSKVEKSLEEQINEIEAEMKAIRNAVINLGGAL